MQSENEFTKPLKARTKVQKNRRWRATVLVFGICMLFALPLFHFYDGFTRVAAFLTPKTPEPKIVVVEKAPDGTLSPITTDENPKPKIDEPEEIDDGIERDGNIIRIKPKAPTLPEPQVAQPIRRQETGAAHLPDPELIEKGATGVIPKRSQDGLRAMDVYSREPDTQGNFGVARVVLVIGGMGISQTTTQQAIQNLPPNVTLAFAPYGNSLTRWMQAARQSGHELLLQVPMEPLDYPQNNPGKHTLRSEADLQENLANLHWAMSRITNYVGIMNYLGNRIMTEPAALTPIFDEIAERGLLFFDDGSVKNSVAEGVSIKSVLPFAKGEILIDNIRSRAAIAEKLDKLSAQAKRTGIAIGVGNAFPDTIAMVADYARRAKESGIEITPLTAVVRDDKK